MEQYGIFISHRHDDWAIAGRVFDYLENRGYQPFLDADSLRQGDFYQRLGRHVREAPYFLCLLTKNTFRTMSEDDWVCREIATALESNREILLLSEKGFSFPENMPAAIEPIRRCHCYEFDRTNFSDVMRRICENDLSREMLNGVLDWRRSADARKNIYLTPRKVLEQDIASLEARFGNELVRCVRSRQEFTGTNHIRSIHLSCYAASIIFSPGIDMVDEQAFDRGLMFNLLAELLKDEEFYLECMITAPSSFAMQEAIDNEKLGNSALEAYPEAIFYSSYCNINALIEEDPVFRNAYRSKRFRFMVTENVLPYALFQIEYKKGYAQYDHIKVDLYSEGIRSSMDRLSMLVFRESDPENYSFFAERYKYLRNIKESKRLISENHTHWFEEWAKLQEEMEI